MRIEFQAGEYPDITLQDFPPDWRDFKILNLSIYSLSKQPLLVRLNICDGEHRSNGYRYSDRFNQELILSQGWNDFSVELEAVKQAPEGREMDMFDVVSMSLFLE